jgi:hypothetical protein
MAAVIGGTGCRHRCGVVTYDEIAMSWLSVSALMGCGQSTREKDETQRVTEQQQSGAFHLVPLPWVRSPAPDAPVLFVLTDGAKNGTTLTRVDGKPQEMQTTDVRHTLHSAVPLGGWRL